MKKIVFRGKELEAPQCIDELTPEQYLLYISRFLAYWWEHRLGILARTLV